MRYVRRISVLLLTGVSLATAFGLLGRVHWFLNLFSHFPVQYLLLAMLLAPLAIFFRRPLLWLACTFLIAAVNLSIVWPFLQQSNAPVAMAGSEIEILLWNVWRKNERWKEVERYIRTTGSDVVILQETSDAILSRVDALENLYEVHVDRDTVVLLARSLRNASAQAHPLPGGYASEIRLLLDGGELAILTTHLPTPILPADVAKRALQLEAMTAWASAQASEHLLIGDFNMTPWSHEHPKLIEEAGLRDSMIGFGIQSSWPFHNVLTSFFRIPIDHCLISPGLVVSKREVSDSHSSNHRPLLVHIHRASGSLSR